MRKRRAEAKSVNSCNSLADKSSVHFLYSDSVFHGFMIIRNCELDMIIEDWSNDYDFSLIHDFYAGLYFAIEVIHPLGTWEEPWRSENVFTSFSDISRETSKLHLTRNLNVSRILSV